MASTTDTKNDAPQAIFNEIIRLTARIESKGLQTPTGASVIEQLARAYRYAAGGAQPGAGKD